MNISTTVQNKQAYLKTVQVKDAIHSYLRHKGYLPLELPVLSPALIPEGYLEIFKTTFTYMDSREDLYLTPSPELFIKRLLTAGIGDCYYMGKSFRNSEPHSPRHFPEFTMLEFYKIGACYKDIAVEVLSMLRAIAQAVYGSPDQIMYQGNTISLERWEEVTIAHVFQQYAGINESTLFDHTLFLQQATEKGYVVEGFTYEDLFSQIYAQEIEPHLGKNGFPTILFDYPKEFAALSKPNPDGKTAQRFEFYIDGLELGNCYSELTDWQEQQLRFQNEQKEREQSGKIKHLVDWGFIDALKQGLPDCAGIAIGVDRLGMIFADTTSIEDTSLISFR
jgi:elongation factor P--beta-lysine ligase